MMDPVYGCTPVNMVVKNDYLSDSGNQTIPRKQIHGEIPSEVDFFAPNSNFSKSRNFYLLTRREFLVWVRFCVDTDPLRSCVALRGRNRSRNCEVRACSGRSVANSQSYGQTARISVDPESPPGPYKEFPAGQLSQFLDLGKFRVWGRKNRLTREFHHEFVS